MRAVTLVADVGESFGTWEHGDDERLIPLLSSANVACGFHAGDPRVMQRTVARCVAAGVSIGAHPGFADLVGFGRRSLDCTGHEVYTDTVYQLGALQAMAIAHGTRVTHVSPHGRLGNLVQSRSDLARAVATAAHDVDPDLVVIGLPGALGDEARALGMTTADIGFIDRAYERDGSLVPRSQEGAVLSDPSEIAERAVRLVKEGRVRTISGSDLRLEVDAILLHGDEPDVVVVAEMVRDALQASGVDVLSLPELLRTRSTRSSAR